jgi:hypothetical protein
MKMKSNTPCLFAALCLVTVSIQAQYSVGWHKIAGGGGTITGGVYSVTGTTGQFDMGKNSGGSYAQVGGFWSLFAIVPTPGAPPLAIELTRTNTAIVSWPSPSAGWRPEQTSDLGSGQWTGSPEVVSDNGATRFIIVNPPTARRFYRLVRP